MRRVPRLRLGLLLACLLVLFPGRGPTTLAPPAGSDDVVVRLSTSPGMDSTAGAFARPPEVLVTGDGTVYVSDREGLRTFRARPAAVLRWLREADHRGLLERDTAARTADGIMDATSTTLTLDAGTVRRRHDVYALGARPGYGALKGYADALRAWAGDRAATAYRPTAYRVLVEDDDGYTCVTAATPPPVTGDVLAVAALLPGDRCPDGW